jgi:HNH endonuclease
MARIRSIHPGQWTDEDFVGLSPFARLLTIGLRNEADDQGVFEWKPRLLKMRLMPADDVSVEELLEEIERANQVRRFKVAGREYGAIRNFGRWQRPKKPVWVYDLPTELLSYVSVGQIKDTHIQDLRKRLWETQGGCCAFCQSSIAFYSKRADSLEIDHAVPISKGGTEDESNLLATCRNCHRSKRDMTESEFREARRASSNRVNGHSEIATTPEKPPKVPPKIQRKEEGGRREKKEGHSSEIDTNRETARERKRPMGEALVSLLASTMQRGEPKTWPAGLRNMQELFVMLDKEGFSVAGELIPALEQLRKQGNPFTAWSYVRKTMLNRRGESRAQADPPVEDEAKWRWRLEKARERKEWCSEAWGPMPYAEGCRVPEHLWADDDSQGWRDVPDN